MNSFGNHAIGRNKNIIFLWTDLRGVKYLELNYKNLIWIISSNILLFISIHSNCLGIKIKIIFYIHPFFWLIPPYTAMILIYLVDLLIFIVDTFGKWSVLEQLCPLLLYNYTSTASNLISFLTFFYFLSIVVIWISQYNCNWCICFCGYFLHNEWSTFVLHFYEAYVEWKKAS